MYEIGGLIIIGILAQWLAWRLRVPAILPLIIAGLLVGPFAEYYFGHRIITPRFESDSESGLFPGNLLFGFVSLAIGLILFEGGLTLKSREIRGLGKSVLRLTTFGALVTTVVAGLAAHYIIGLSWQLSFLFSTLIVVTGPTVITPILRQINVKRQIATILKWESIVIDPIGAFLAVLFYNFIMAYIKEEATIQHALIEFFRSGLAGIGLGVVFGFVLYQIIVRHLVPKYLLNVFTLATVVGAFMFSNLIAEESGLLTTVVMGAFVANRDDETAFLDDLLDFKESLTLLLISLLFILLSANMTVDQIQLVLSPQCLLVFLIIVFVARPLGVFWSLAGSEFDWRDKAFISWVGPRGIVAAGVASLFGIELEKHGIPMAEYITPLVFLIVLGTVLLNATLAGFIARKLRVSLPEGSGILIFGSGEGVRRLATRLRESGREVTMVTANPSEAETSREANLNVVFTQVNTNDLDEKTDLTDIGYVLAMTGSDEDNAFLLNNYRRREGIRGAYRLINRRETKQQRFSNDALFGPYASYLLTNRTARQHEGINVHTVVDPDNTAVVLEKLRQQKAIPLYLRCTASGDITFITAPMTTLASSVNDELFYFGERLSDSDEQEKVKTVDGEVIE
ncbi:cation:proton antiporter [Neolewinella persica]|uniref:cation:proton antiporter n=1 Tax=Neolewinella persica TaxID=70998 RepID=UPI00036CBFA7|nr:sodium:proton antiporter [Neolewinella persica]